jgi:hypothetical protein
VFKVGEPAFVQCTYILWLLDFPCTEEIVEPTVTIKHASITGGGGGNPHYSEKLGRLFCFVLLL